MLLITNMKHLGSQLSTWEWLWEPDPLVMYLETKLSLAHMMLMMMMMMMMMLMMLMIIMMTTEVITYQGLVRIPRSAACLTTSPPPAGSKCSILTQPTFASLVTKTTSHHSTSKHNIQGDLSNCPPLKCLSVGR